MQLALSSNSLGPAQLYDFGQNFIRPQLETVPGAALPSPYGGQVRGVQVDLNQQKMQAEGVSAEDVVDALNSQNLTPTAGEVKMGPFNWNVELNADPLRRAELNDLPVRRVNGTVIYLRDVGYAHDGGPPPSNVVRVDGQNAVLMSVLKSGAASTLSIISQIKKLLPRVEAGLPASLHLEIVNDQSVFVRAAVSGVVREMVIAAVLVGLLILLFLGSWRSTVIILIEIPLAILFSLVALSLSGQSMNVMTLGGLALAVGILVDDGTVTIENINYHLELGKTIVPAILDGAQQIVVPAFVTLLCLSIVFVPMFQLGGVAGFLFRPMALAVVFALVGSFILSRTLVPTMASYLMRADAGDARHGASPAPSCGGIVNAFRRFQIGFEARFQRLRELYRSLLAVALANPRAFIIGFLACVVLSFGLTPFLGRNFFPNVDSGEILIHIRGHGGLRVEQTAKLFGDVEHAVRRVIPQSQLANVTENIGLPCQRHQHGISEYRHGRAGGRRHADHPRGRSLADRRLRQNAAHRTAARVPRHHLLVPARRHHLADPQFRPAGADRREGDRREATGQLRVRLGFAAAHPTRPGHRRRPHPAGVRSSSARRRRAADAGRGSRTYRA